MSLIELLIATTLLVMTLGAVVLVSSANDRAYQTGVTAAHLDAQLGIAVDRVVGELRVAAMEDTVLPVPGLTGPAAVTYAHATDYVAGEVVKTPPRRLEFEYDFGELDDGLDNNGNGLVDEGRIVLTEDIGTPNERRRVLTRWVSEWGEPVNGVDDNGNGLVDEPGFWVEPVGGAEETLSVFLSLSRWDRSGRVASRTSLTSIRIRN
jgi:hypothetical protein